MYPKGLILSKDPTNLLAEEKSIKQKKKLRKQQRKLVRAQNLYIIPMEVMGHITILM